MGKFCPNKAKMTPKVFCFFLTLASWLHRLFPGSPRRSHLRDQPHRHQTKIRMTAAVLLMSVVCFQVFLAIRGSVEFLSSLPFPAERLAGAPWQLCLASSPWSLSQSSCPEQTPRGVVNETRPWPAVMLNFPSADYHLQGSPTKDGVGSTGGPCLGKNEWSLRFRAGGVWTSVMYA